MNLAGKVVVVTGASAGVGRAAARLFAERGARVGLIARGREGLTGARREIGRAGGLAIGVCADVSDPDQLESAAVAIEAALGPIDVWVNNAMVSVFSRVADLSAAEVRRVTEVTYLGSVYGMMSALKRMRRRGGVIVQVGSALAYRGIPLQAPYCGAKHALVGFIDSLRCELLHDKIPVRLSCVLLPALNTPQFDWSRSRMPRRAQPVPPIYQPELAAKAIVWAATHPRREFSFGWPTLVSRFGQKLFPSLADRYLARTAFDAQQSPEPEAEDRADNLFEPLAGDRGARGRFDGRASARSPHLWMTTHRSVVLGAAAAAGAIVLRRTRRGH